MVPDVELQSLTKTFGSVTAVDNVSFAVSSGSFFSLLGPSGCGKSTLLRVISGFEQPDRGTVLIAGTDMANTPAYRRPTALVFQRWALFPHLSVFDNVAFGLKIQHVGRPEIRQRVGELLDLVGLGGLQRRKPNQLSGGQQQRVALARALATRPRVLLLDEPLGSLDLKLRLQMQMELKRIQKEVGTTFIYVTHDQGEAMTMSDTIAVVNRGRIEQMDSPRAIYDRPATTFVAGFIGDTNLFDGVVKTQDGSACVVQLRGLTVTASRLEGQPPSGTPVTLSLRYERVMLGDDLGTANQFPGRIRDVVFSGSSVRYLIDVPNADAQITAETRYDGVSPLFAQGETVKIGWEPEAAVVLAA